MVFDGHNDLLTSDKSYLQMARYLIAECGKTDAHAVLALWTTELKENPYNILDVADKHLRKHGFDKRFPLAVEDLSGFTKYGYEGLKKYNLLYASLTWNRENALAGGANSDIGLKPAGRVAAAALRKTGAYLDTAHLCRASFFEALTLDNKLLCSHTACDALRKHPRNLTDEQIDGLIARGGKIGVVFVREFLTDASAATSADVARHIDRIVQKHGAGAVFISTDYFGSDQLASDLKSYRDMPVLVEKLRKMGYNDKAVGDVLFNNLRDLCAGR
ncbi:MAG: membrane dipeptidase [Firmicutes bacterium]|nr:membrane dipeptidase [Bacillota bacterium]